MTTSRHSASARALAGTLLAALLQFACSRPADNVASNTKNANEPALPIPVDTGGKITVKYDKFRDMTDVGTGEMRLADSSHRTFLIMGGYPGQKPSRHPSFVVFSFSSSIPDEQLLEGDEVIFLLDGTRRIESANPSHSGEFAMMSVNSNELRSIGASKKVEMKVGGQEYTLTPLQLGAIRDLSSRLAGK